MTAAEAAGTGASYAAAGVDIEAGERAVSLMRSKVARTRRPEVRTGLGGFAGLFELDVARYRKPVLATSTDGVGTKVALATALDRHDTIGRDLVAMVVDDLVVTGAEPLFMEDYIACGKVVPERIAEIVSGIADGCVLAGCALLGGETAEHPDLMAPDEYDISGTGVGVVEADEVLGAHRVEVGDVLIAMASSGLHSNGYSLVRHVLLPQQADGGPAAALQRVEPSLGRTLGDELLEPTRIYAQDCLALLRATPVKAFCHITGGGLTGNLPRILPEHADAVVDRATWAVPPVFSLVQEAGSVASQEMEQTFNLGVGMVAVLPAAAAPDTLDVLRDRGVPGWVVGDVRAGSGKAVLSGSHPSAGKLSVGR